MVRYTVIIVTPSDSPATRILVVISPEALVSVLIGKVIQRLPKLFPNLKETNDDDIILHLGAADGPILDAGDLLSDAIENPRGEEIFAVLNNDTTPSTSSIDVQADNSNSIRIRVITPELARAHADPQGIPLLKNESILPTSTLAELELRVRRHLGLSDHELVLEKQDCNCSFARIINNIGTINNHSDKAVNAMNSLVVVHGKNEVTHIPVGNGTTLSALGSALNSTLPAEITTNHLTMVGGVIQERQSGHEVDYSKLPVASYCSSTRHKRRRTHDEIISGILTLDLHTSEVSIEITSYNCKLTLAELGLVDCMINGVLTLYAVQRCVETEKGGRLSTGNDGMFQGSAWSHPVEQSQRGMSVFLSTLRVLQQKQDGLFGGDGMEEAQQDGLLHLVRLLTRFPPAVRAMYTLMQKKTMSFSERAALSQSLYEVLKDIVPLEIVKSTTRLFEGSRLLFGLLLEKAKHLKVTEKGQSARPYLKSLRTIDLRNRITMEPVAIPVQAVIGLIDKGVADAFSANGSLKWTDDTNTTPVGTIDIDLQRIALLSGGSNPYVATYNDESRRADGTAIFDASFGDQLREVKEPDEVLMFCIDCSASMGGESEFPDVGPRISPDDLYKERLRTVSATLESQGEDLRYDRPSLDEMKGFLSSHESFSDMLAIVQTGVTSSKRQLNAEEILKLLDGLAREQIMAESEELRHLHDTGINQRQRRKTEELESSLAALKNRVIRLRMYRDALSAFLVYRSEHSIVAEPMPPLAGEAPGSSSVSHFHNCPHFDIPTEMTCPITSDLMIDPVSTVDNFTYERVAIERWLQTHERSPCTNLKLKRRRLRPNGDLKQRITDWTNAIDITSQYGNGAEKLSLSFKSPLEAWTVAVAMHTTMHDVFAIAFRGTRGRYAKFTLDQNQIQLNPSTVLARTAIAHGGDILVKPLTIAQENQGSGKYCLIKQFVQNIAGVREYIALWTNIRSRGDGHTVGSIENHWTPLKKFLHDESWYESLESEDQWDLDEQRPPPVFKVWLGGAAARSTAVLSRLDVVKQSFEAFMNRVLAYNFQTHIGLVTIRSQPALVQVITHAIEEFRHQLNNIRADGDTALWDSISLAQDQLQSYSQRFPKAKLRIICLSDGEDNKSSQTVHDLSVRLLQSKIVLDSISIGNNNDELKTLAHLTGGYKFHLSSVEQAMTICELEPVLSQLERPEIKLPASAFKHLSVPRVRFLEAGHDVATDEVRQDKIPDRKVHPLLGESFVELGTFARQSNIASRSDNNSRLSRIHNELRNTGAKGHPSYDVYVCESNMAFWKVVIEGPTESSFVGGTFLIYLEMHDNFPAFAPECRFVTPMYHPNINSKSIKPLARSF
ncbi:hypothetical protein BU24DRAFT_484177 [Aaosphaeria arxii CBS 175.79]|uniref:peptidylprolyl isomerase n=1 Tax=Aaosphaeria arxii CBS 175.79 TaxID=1450172 RepID=A0A6A5XIB9_9PLEO|nr:uncharacterized protein BU24DRAFT_484177 [Aaosphaeria arxii CBS 175.79]KAF2012520.1 hypothetical protein BU24DRAFT_484177 [Aaosphaeria arxii CBS 175.79]